ncbi:MAG TPA: hypothetical protein PKH97_07755 [Tetrasphaera sp.]|mgnify:CR=1|uniref:hypothetical protein n=1 Tax=Nostocoides sp. TaxID=1917966 RepID=UPI002C8B53D4|nr:hypothetical protein [Tetrasphaera sp.]HNQ07063.1 hypothetical protein [Tetrasphaera sp.]
MSTTTMITSVVPASLSAAYPTHAAAQVLSAAAGFAGVDRTKDGWGSPPGWSP